MRKQLAAGIAVLLFFPILFSVPACVKDKCSETHSYTYFIPVYKAKEAVVKNIRNNSARPIETPGKIYIYDKYIFLNEVDKGIHIIDNSDPANPQNVAFVDIPGNMDIAVKENILYADMYGDMVALDIADPKNVKLIKTLESVFPERNWANGFSVNNGNIVVDWIQKDTVVVENCSKGNDIFGGARGVFFNAASDNSFKSTSPVGTGGSMARFTIVNDYLYTVDRHTLRCYSITNAKDPVRKNDMYAGWDIETIYPFKNTLFIGSMGGMFIYDITTPNLPVLKSSFVHARACDPVIADEKYAYVTLKAGTNCGPAANELQVINVEDPTSPVLKKTYPMNSPSGLSKDGDLLLVCDGSAGLKAFNSADPANLRLIKTIGDMVTYDVIAMNGIALVVATNGLYQYDYSAPANIKLLSKIPVGK